MKSNRSLMAYLLLFIKGFCMGASDVVPGVSGGTIAFILGIYKELIKSIKSFDLIFFRKILSFKIKDAMNHISWQFLLFVGIGILTAIFSLARILSWLLQNQPVLIWSFFFGLIVASVFTVSLHIGKWSLSIVIWGVTGAAGTYYLVGMLPSVTPNTPWFLFMSGAIAICAMILPGISGAFILVLLGKYHYILEAVNNHDFYTLFLVGSGACMGLIIFVRLLNWLFNKYNDLTIAILTGLMLGSLRKIWPWKKTLEIATDLHGNLIATTEANILPQHWNIEVITAILLIAAGFLTVFSLDYLAEKEK